MSDNPYLDQILEEMESVEVPQVQKMVEAEVSEKKKRVRKAKQDDAAKLALEPKSNAKSKAIPKPKGARKLSTKLVLVEDKDTGSTKSSELNPGAPSSKKLVLQEDSDSD